MEYNFAKEGGYDQEPIREIDFYAIGKGEEYELPKIPIPLKTPGVLDAIRKTAKGMLYGEALPEGLGYLQKPVEAVVDWLSEGAMTPDEELELQKNYPNLMAARYAAASLLLPGVSEKLASPRELKEWEEKPIELQRADIAGLAAGYAVFGAGMRAGVEGAAYLAAKYPTLTKTPLKALTESTWWRRLTIKERGVAVQTAAQRKAAGLTDAELKVELDSFYSSYFKEKVRAAGRPPKPEAPARPPEPKPPEPKAPVTELAKDFKVAVKAERKPSPLVELKKTKDGVIDFEAVGKEIIVRPPTEPIELGAPKPPAPPPVTEVVPEGAVGEVPKIPEKPPVKPKVAEKQPWEMTRDEFEVATDIEHGTTDIKIARKIGEEGLKLMPPRDGILDIPDTAFFLPKGSGLAKSMYSETVLGKINPDAKILKAGTREFKDFTKGIEFPEYSGMQEVLRKAKVDGFDIVAFDTKSTGWVALTDNAIDFKSHKSQVKQAISEGKPVSAEVLADYPDLAKPTPKELRDVEVSDDITYLYSGFPINEAAKALKKTYQKHIGDPLWNFVSETLPLEAGKRSEFLDKVNKGLILDYRKDPDFVELRDDTVMRIQQHREKAKEVAVALSKFPRAEQIRIAQIIEGGVTATPKRYEKAFGVIKDFQRLEKELQELGLLGPENLFRQLTRKEIAGKFKEISVLDGKIKKAEKKLEPIVKTSKVIRRVSEDISEEIISTEIETTTGTYETKVNKWSELNEQRIVEALAARGFAPGEVSQMIRRVKESVVPIEGQKGTLKEIREKVEKVVTKTITQEIERLKTYTPSMMARARGSIVKDINKLQKERSEMLKRIQLHYKMSGKEYLKKAYAAIEEEKHFIKDLLFRLRKKPRLIKGYEIRRKDLTKEYEDYLGRIRQAPYLVYKGLSSETHDVELMRMFVKISENKKWAISPKELETMMSVKDRRKEAEKYENFKPLPPSTKLGPLSKAMVDPYIWDDLNQMVIIENEWVRAWDGLIRLWKTGKVVYNPATQVRNMLSNTILADLAGLNPHRVDIYAEAARDLLKKSGYYKEVKEKTTLLGTEWAGAEIKQFLSEAGQWTTGDFSVKTASTFKKVLDIPGKTYQGVEQFFKLAVYINERKGGATIKDAAKHAEKYIFNYQKIPPAIRWAKRWYSPFITFTYKALPRVAETAVRQPWKLAKYLVLMKVVEEITRRMHGESDEEVEREKRVLPNYMRKKVLPGQLGHLRVPYKDKYGRSKYLDLTFILPWGDIGEQWGQGELPFPLRAVPRPFMPNMPFYMIPAEWGFNEVFFTGQELILKSDDWTEASAKIGKQVWRQLVPSLAGSYGYNKIMAAWHGERDWAFRDRSLGEALFDSFLGIKLRSIDYNEELGKRMREFKKERNEIRRVYVQKFEDLYRNPTPDVDTDRRRAQKIYETLNKKLDKIIDKMTEIQK